MGVLDVNRFHLLRISGPASDRASVKIAIQPLTVGQPRHFYALQFDLTCQLPALAFTSLGAEPLLEVLSKGFGISISESMKGFRRTYAVARRGVRASVA